MAGNGLVRRAPALENANANRRSEREVRHELERQVRDLEPAERRLRQVRMLRTNSAWHAVRGHLVRSLRWAEVTGAPVDGRAAAIHRPGRPRAMSRDVATRTSS